ncbi:TRAP transporter substrate-binding protein [Oceanobacter mangrovi]|uniref:TRAP transporter substrate-binding protein n=1 Tax=Oceanobacter mangrovi TaxID=2862510 RepID=UPI001C8D5355|nr:TRAP transporter substrate-binding protein [Oceanobacter mangrovi]
MFSKVPNSKQPAQIQQASRTLKHPPKQPRRLSQKLTAAVAMLMVSGTALAAEFNFKMHHQLPPSSGVHTRLLVPWAEAIEQESNGRIHIDVYPAMQLGGKPPQLFDQSRKGMVDITWTVAGYTPGRFNKSEVFELPFMAGRAEITSQAIQQYADEEMKEAFDDVKLLTIHTNATGVLHSRDKAIHSAADLKDLKVRAPNKVIAEAYTRMGAMPIFMPAPQMASALSKGVIDVASLSYDILGPMKVHELVSSHTEMSGDRGLYAQVFLFSMNKKSYESLPADLRAIIDRHSGLPLAAHFGKVLDEMGDEGKQLAESTHNPIYVIDPQETSHIRELVQPVIDDWIADMDAEKLNGKHLYQRANELIGEFSKADASKTAAAL